MKKATLLSIICLASLITFAQEEETLTKKPIQGNKIVGFDIAGLSAMALNSPIDPLTNAQMFDFRYFFQDYIAFRVGLGINNRTTTITTKSDPANHPIIENTNEDKKSGYSIGLGVEKHIKTKSRSLSPYIGAGLYLTLLGDNNVDDKNKVTQASGDYTDVHTVTINPGGTVFGLALNGGFMWFFTQNLALGGEFSLGFGSGTIGGDVEVKTTTTTSSSGTVTTQEMKTKSVNEIKYSGLGTLNTNTIRFLVKF